MKTRWIAIVLAAVLVTVAGGTVLWWRPWESAPASEDGTSVVVGKRGARLSLGKIEVVIPAGAVPQGTRLAATAARELNAPDLADSTRRAGGGIQLRFDGGRQPRLPLTIRFPVTQAPPDGFAPVVITRPSDQPAAHLVPATYDDVRHLVVAQIDHLSETWGAFIDFRGLGRQVMGKLAPFLSGVSRPDCAGNPATEAVTTVKITGNYGVDQVPVAWPCVSLKNGTTSVTLTANARVPYRIDAPKGWPAPTMGTLDVPTSVVQRAAQALPRGSDRYRDLLMPNSTLTYTVPTTSLPAVLHGRVDPGPYLGLILAWVARLGMDLFGVHIDELEKLENSVDLLTCAADAGTAAFASNGPFNSILANTWRTIKSCVSAVAGAALSGKAGFVFDLLAGGIGLVVAGVEGVVRSIASPRFDLPLTVSQPPKPTTVIDVQPWSGESVASPYVVQKTTNGECFFNSELSWRADAFRCITPDSLLYDPCFAAPSGAQVACPVEPEQVIVLSLTTPLPEPSDLSQGPFPFLLVLDTGEQCWAWSGAGPLPIDGKSMGMACGGGRAGITGAWGAPDDTTSTWTISTSKSETGPLTTSRITAAYR